MTFRIRSSVVGAIGKSLDERLAQDKKAVADAMRAATLQLKNGWRAQIIGAGVSAKVANAVRSKAYPQSGGALDPAGLVYVNRGSPEKLIANMRAGRVIVANHAKYLAIPTENVPHGNHGKKLGPLEFQSQTGIILHWAKARDGTRLLVGDAIAGRSAAHKYRAPTKGRQRQGRKAESVVFFILVAQATIRKRLDLDGEVDRAERNLAGLIAERLS